MSDSISPVLFICKAHKHYSADYVAKDASEQELIDKSNFYRCNSSNGNILDYLTRRQALELDKENLDEETLEFMNRMAEDGSFENQNYLNYMGNRNGSTGLFDRNGFMDANTKRNYAEKLKETHSVIWDAVISFIPSYSDKYCDNTLQAQNLVKSTIDDFFKKAGLNPGNMEWTGAYHVNTDNRHIHLCFWEKEPNTPKYKFEYAVDKNGEIIKDKNGKGKKVSKLINDWSDWNLPKTAVNNYRTDIMTYHKFQEGLTNDFLKLRDPILQNIKLHNKTDINILKKLQADLGEIKSYQYARLSKDNMKTLNKYVEAIIKSEPELFKSYQEYMDGLLNYQKELICNYNETKVIVPKELKNYFTDRKNEFYNRAGNVVLKELKELDLDLNYFQNENKLKNQNVENTTTDEIIIKSELKDDYFSDEKPKQINIIDEKTRTELIAKLTKRNINLNIKKPISNYKDSFNDMISKGWKPRTSEERSKEKEMYRKAFDAEEDFQNRLIIHREFVKKAKSNKLKPGDVDPIKDGEKSPLKEYYKNNLKRYNPLSASCTLNDEREIFNTFGIDFVSTRISKRELYSITDSTDKNHTEKYHIKKFAFKCNCEHYIFRNAKNEFIDYTVSYPSKDDKNENPIQFGFSHVLKELGLTNKDILKLGTMLKKDGEAFNLLTKTGSFDANFSDLSEKYKEFDGEKSYSNLGYNKEISKMQNAQYASANNRISHAFGSILGKLMADMERPRGIKWNWANKPKDKFGNELSEEEIQKLKEKEKNEIEW